LSPHWFEVQTKTFTPNSYTDGKSVFPLGKANKPWAEGGGNWKCDMP